MYRTVLLPVDLNHEASWTKALPEAGRIARESGGALHVLAIVPDFGMSLVGGYFPEGFERAALERARKALDDFLAANKPEGVEPVAHLGHGHVPEEVLRVADEIGADLVVMASHPPDALRELLVGSNAERILRHSPVSVLVVR